MKPAIDAHAHLRPSLSSSDVEGIRDAFVMAVTRSPGEWWSALRRRDRRISWGIGCHPADVAAIAGYQELKFAAVAGRASFVGEVGLETRSRVPIDDQEVVFRSILRIAGGEGLIASVHSSGLTGRVLDCLEEASARNVVLHWWAGTPAETDRAVKLGCFFSVNTAVRPEVLVSLPPGRVLTETDFPTTWTRDRSVDRPGAVSSIENRLAATWDLDTEQLRETEWEAVRILDRDAGRLAASTASLRTADPASTIGA